MTRLGPTVWSYSAPIGMSKITPRESKRDSDILDAWLGTGLALSWNTATPPFARDQEESHEEFAEQPTTVDGGNQATPPMDGKQKSVFQEITMD